MSATLMAGQLPTLSILKNYYPVVKDLRTYLTDVLDTPQTNLDSLNGLLAESDDLPAYCDLINTSYVATKASKERVFQIYPPMLEMREVIDQAQERLFKLRRTQNIITSGYRLASHDGDRGKKGMTRMGITNYFINTMITALQGPEWEALLCRIGEDAMLHILTETSVFIPLPNGCLCQITGDPLHYLTPSVQSDIKSDNMKDIKSGQEPEVGVGKKRSCQPGLQDQRPYKRRKLDGSASKPLTVKPTMKGSPPADVALIRARLFYSRPNFLPHSNKVLFGLPLKHVLNRLHPSYVGKKIKLNNMAVTDPQKQAQNVRQLSKYIFARQYSLATPFRSGPPKGSYFKYADYLDREAEINAAGPCKTPKRLKDMLPLLGKLLRRHERCGYKSLLDKACPSKMSTGSKDLDSSFILELMSEDSVQLRSQISLGVNNTSVDSTGNPIFPLGLTQARKHARNKPRFIEFACSQVEVYRYVALVTNAVIPKTFWGSKKNLRLILQHVKEFISCRRYETLSVHYLLQRFSTTACDWLIPPGSGAQQQARVSVSDALKRRELLEDFLFWYFDSFVSPLLKTTYYITESSAFRNQVLYFRHDDWATLCAPLIERLTSTTFMKITDAEAADILRQRRLGFSFVRLLPKETGVRPIVNLRRKKPGTRGSFRPEQSINQILQAAFSILTFERANQPHLLGASVLGPDEIHLKLKKFKVSLPRDSNGVLPKLYFVKVDVQACFDTIEQTKLLHILRQVISEDVYMMQKYGQINMSLGKMKRTYVKKAVPEDDQPHFIQYATDLANVLRNIIFVDQVVYPASKKQDVLQLLEEHITENLVKIGQDYYRQTVGIPQGSVLSTILCSFFYGDLEKQFSRYRNDPQSVLLRLIDDYLFVTTSSTLAKGFLDMMNKGHPEYGCFISPDKTLTNFDYGDHVVNVIAPHQRTFPWCGYAIGTTDLSIRGDYTRYYGSGIQGTLTVDRGRHPGATFMYKMLQMAQAKSHAIFSDRDLNTEHVVYLNIYQNSLLTALKMHEYLRSWGVGGKRNNVFLRNAIRKAVMFTFTSVRAQARRKAAQNAPSHTEIHKEAVLWLGNHAFHYILSRKPHDYKSLLIYLVFELGRPKYRRYYRRFKGLLREGQAGLVPIINLDST